MCFFYLASFLEKIKFLLLFPVVAVVCFLVHIKQKGEKISSIKTTTSNESYS